MSHLRWEPTSQALRPDLRDRTWSECRGRQGLTSPGRSFQVEQIRPDSRRSSTGRRVSASASRWRLMRRCRRNWSPPPTSSLFETANERDGALAAALRTLPRTVGVRDRYSVGTGGAAANRDASQRATPRPNGATARPTRVFYWVGLTVGQPFNTGVQRVTRSLGAGLQKLGVELVPVKWDSSTGAMAPISDDEAAHLAKWSGPLTRPRPLPAELAGEWLLVPEITVPVVPPGSNVPPRAFTRDARGGCVLRRHSGQDAGELSAGHAECFG